MSTTQTKKLSEATVVQSIADADKIPIVNSSGQTMLVPLSGLLGAVKVGGRNLVKNSGVEISNKYDTLARYQFGEDKPNAGEKLTLSLWGELGADVPSLTCFVSGSDKVNILPSHKAADGRYIVSLTLGVQATSVVIFQGPNHLHASTIHRIKIERGNIPTDWTPAPEDWGG